MSKHYLIPLLMVVAWGCKPSMPSAADPARARTALVTSLDAWCKGTTPESLHATVPPIFFNDEMWRAKERLTSYEILAERPSGQGWSCEVLLELEHQANRVKKRTVNYLIDTDPALVIVQQP